ncbi:hypothetical protein LCGC14_1780200 [marine sediment metagenome]|uniref:Uncharacterized protein n=1 Tax=marine sediment metagenome TaxID=412755 RepID=A0A0F9GVS8_9ZZZZ
MSTVPKEGKAHRCVSLALEHAVERGKLKPFEALEAAEHFGVQLQSWVQRQHDHYRATNKAETDR